jgi:three-Cys-motif partner protein
MRDADRCVSGGITKANGNCTDPDPADGLSVQCVGPWASEKHNYLSRYIETTKFFRKKFLTATSTHPVGGAAFIDLFAGPGRARIFSNGRVIDGSPLIALAHAAAPFTRVVLCDIDEENVSALRARTAVYGDRAVVVPGDCNTQIDMILAEVPRHGLNLALIDPFNLESLSFQTLAKLAQVKRMDLIVHFPTMDAKRNHAFGAVEKLGRATGTANMGAVIHKPKDTAKAISELRANLQKLGYTGKESRTAPIKNLHNGILYHLVYFSKVDKGDSIWNSIAKTTSSGQRSLL